MDKLVFLQIKMNCKELNRQFIGFEIDEKYWKIANNRLNGLTNDDVEKNEEGQMTLF